MNRAAAAATRTLPRKTEASRGVGWSDISSARVTEWTLSSIVRGTAHSANAAGMMLPGLGGDLDTPNEQVLSRFTGLSAAGASGAG